MKTILFFFILFCVIAMPALGELTKADLDQIHLIIIDSEKRVKGDSTQNNETVSAHLY